MNMGTTLTFDLPQGWTLRQVASSLARVWLPPFRAKPVHKGAPWMVQPVMEEPAEAGAPLWEAGITTEEYQERLDRADLQWTIRAKAGRNKGTVLARLALRPGNPTSFEMVCSQDSFPATLFDDDKLHEFLKAQGTTGADGLFGGLLVQNGFRPIAV
ncbi:MAG TPA: hypothetical protein VNT75_23005 [Symbiobacteriaceae bacterium]|nr:hypothetical protein [Symbiobacteriaceae bacterium]